jgi:hypothetical protein
MKVYCASLVKSSLSNNPLPDNSKSGFNILTSSFKIKTLLVNSDILSRIACVATARSLRMHQTSGSRVQIKHLIFILNNVKHQLCDLFSYNLPAAKVALQPAVATQANCEKVFLNSRIYAGYKIKI